MAMVEATIHEEPLQMFAQMFLELHRAQPQEGTVGVAMIPMVMAGQIKVTSSHMSQLSGAI
tara:strand:- start:249 stop:431 length:183 start_codon:yes stop_codon:yes gene_type:complete